MYEELKDELFGWQIKILELTTKYDQTTTCHNYQEKSIEQLSNMTEEDKDKMEHYADKSFEVLDKLEELRG